jgi:ABC-type sulfate transport system substrate-binding protein
MRFRDLALVLLILSAALALSVAAPARPVAAQGEVTLLNVSYDPTR